MLQVSFDILLWQSVYDVFTVKCTFLNKCAWMMRICYHFYHVKCLVGNGILYDKNHVLVFISIEGEPIDIIVLINHRNLLIPTNLQVRPSKIELLLSVTALDKRVRIYDFYDKIPALIYFICSHSIFQSQYPISLWKPYSRVNYDLTACSWWNFRCYWKFKFWFDLICQFSLSYRVTFK